MVAKTFSTYGYDGFNFYELLVVNKFMSENDYTGLHEIIVAGKMTDGMRLFVADLATGKLKRPSRKKPSTVSRDINIFDEVRERNEQGEKLDSIFDDISSRIYLSKEVIKGIYYKWIGPYNETWSDNF